LGPDSPWVCSKFFHFTVKRFYCQIKETLGNGLVDAARSVLYNDTFAGAGVI
jgi:hypothetical protein